MSSFCNLCASSACACVSVWFGASTAAVDRAHLSSATLQAALCHKIARVDEINSLPLAPDEKPVFDRLDQFECAIL